MRRRQLRSTFKPTLLAILLAFPAQQALAVSCTRGPTTGNWGTAGDWSCNAVPGFNDDATIAAGKTVTVDLAQSVRNLSNAGDINIDLFLLTLSGIGNTTNTGTINVGGASPAALNANAGHDINNTGGSINIGNGSRLNQLGGAITGGTITTAGGGTLTAHSSSSNFLSGAILNGTLDMASQVSSRERVTNDLTLNGTVSINNSGILSLEGTQSLDGNGNIIFGSTGPNNKIDLEGNGTTTLGPDITVRGHSGTIGLSHIIGGTQTLLNNGQISADTAGGTIVITQSNVTNNNLLEARNGGTLNLESQVTNTGPGVIRGDNGVVLQSGVRVIGGSIETVNGGVFRPTTGPNNYLDATTVTGTLDMATAFSSRERVINGLTLNGTVNLNSQAMLSFEGTQTVGGNGTIVLGDAGPANRIYLDGNGATTFGADITIRGENGTIGEQLNIGGTQTLVNNGKISADVNAGTISITQSAVSNNNLMEARNGSTLSLLSDVTNSGLGVILADDNGVVLQSGQRVTGGAINSANGGLFRAANNSNNYLDATTLNGTLDLSTVTGRERVLNGLTLNGRVNLDDNSILSFEGTQTVAGIGSIVLGATGAANRIALDGNGTTTIGSGITIHGENGTIGQEVNIGGTQTLLNNGKISADVSGGTITINDSAVTNNGTLEARNGGTLILSSNVTGGASGQIIADTGSSVVQDGVVISGTVNTSGSGSFRATNSAANFLTGVTLNGNLDLVTTSARERVNGGGLTLNGRIDIDNNGILSFEGDGALDGDANIVLGSTGPGNRVALDGSGTTTFGANVTIRGENGSIGGQHNIGGTQTLVNNGKISADVSGGTITINDSAVTNNGTLEARNGGTLVLSSNVSGGQIIADAGSSVVQSAVTISGTVNTSGSGNFRATNSAANFLTGVTLNGNLDLTTTSARERINGGGLTLNGRIDIDNNGILSFEGDGALDGNATIVFGSTGTGNRVDLDGNGTTTFGANVTIHGENGTIGRQLNIGGTQTLVNNGKISADVSGGTITIRDSAVSNNNVLEARNGASLNLQSNVSNSNVGVILADNGVVIQSGSGVTGGTIDTTNGGAFRVALSNSNFLDGTAITGVVDMATIANTRERVVNGLSLDGAININRQGNLRFEGTQTVAGTGEIIFGDTASANRIDLDGNGTTTLGADITIRGQNGTIGLQSFVGGTQTLVNNGTVIADVGGGTITVTESALVNNGMVRASAGTVNVSAPLSGTGTLQVDATGAMNLANGAKAQGQLIMGASGAALNLGTGDLTIGSDYTNVAAGTGNSFDRRAGVSGAGQILAGGDAVQEITGSSVSNGDTPNATMTIGNVRVGTNNLAYQITNTGSTGPQLRGAVQTSVNGANLSDARLSGAGVTAGNYNTGGPGSNTGDQVVTFTAAAAGTLDPLTGQILNLRSNFENIADQKLNIVIGSGAAAYNAAVGNAASPVQVANQRVGGNNTAAVTVSNTSAAGLFSEDLNVSVVGSSGATGSGTITGRLAGTDNTGSGSITVGGLDTSSAGAKNGTVTLAYETEGEVNGVSNGLGTAPAGSQIVAVSGNVYRLADGAATPTPISFGNRHVGDSASQVLTVQNTALSDGFSEKLNVTFGANSGAVSNNAGDITLLAAGDSNASNMSINMDTGTAGAKSGSATLNFASDGTGTSDLAATGAGSQTINVTGAVYNLASSSTISPITLVAHVGDGGGSVEQALTITNTAPAGAFSEGLNSSFGGFSGGVGNTINPTLAGMITNLAAGSTDNSSMTVAISTATAGVFNGTVTVDQASNGDSTSGLGITDLTSQQVVATGSVTAGVFNYAQATINTAQPLDFGKVRIGTAVASQTVSIGNTAPVSAFSELLDGSVVSAPSPFTAAGSFSGLESGAPADSSISVGMNTDSAGHQAGNVVLGFVSDGTAIAGNGTRTPLANQNLAVSGDVYRLASPSLNTTDVTLVARRADAAPTATISVDNASPDGFTEGLKAGFGALAAGFSGSGNIANLAAQGTDASSLQVTLDTSAAGSFGGDAQLDFESTGVGTTGAPDISLGSQLVSLAGKVYEKAVAQVNTVLVDFGIVHKDEVVAAKNVSVSNSAPVVALNDTLQGSFINLPDGPFGSSGSVSGLAAGQTDASSLLVSLDTTSAGVFTSGGDKLQFASHNPDMANLDLGNAALTLQAQVNEYANPIFQKTAGTGVLSGGGFDFLLDFGTLTAGGSGGMVSALLQLANDVSGPADLLDGAYRFALNEFLKTGFGAFSDLGAGDAQSGLQISLETLNVGDFSDTIVLAAVGHNRSGYSAAFQDIRLTVQARVEADGSQVPEPGTLLLLTIALAIIVLQRRRGILD